MTLTTATLPTNRMRNDRDPIDGAPRCQTQWHLRLDEHGEVDVFAREYYGGDVIPFSEWHKRTLTWGFASRGDCSVIDSDKLRDDLSEGGTLRALLERVHAGHSVTWNGNNHVGELDQDGGDAQDEIEQLLSGYDCAYTDHDAPELWHALDWLLTSQSPQSALDDMGLSTDATGEQIAAAAKIIEYDASTDNIELAGTTDAIEIIIERVKADHEEAA